MVDGLGYCYPHLVVESPHNGAGINVAGIPRRNNPAMVFTVAQQQGLMTLGLAGLGSPERRLFQCPIRNDVRVNGPSVNEVHCPVKTIGVFVEVELKLRFSHRTSEFCESHSYVKAAAADPLQAARR